MVEWKKLGSISDIGTGSNNREDACENGLYPFYVRSKEVLRINTFLYDEEAILIPGEGGIGEIFHYVNGKYGLHQRTYRVHPISKETKGRYLYYYLFENFGAYIEQKSYKSTAASIRKPMLLDFPVAIPSLSEQTRIVGILDTFTASIENLKEQIKQRRKQYEHYRDQLLDLEGKEGVEMKTIGGIGDFFGGLTGKTKDDFADGNAKFITYMNVFTNPSLNPSTTGTVKIGKNERQNKIKKGDILFTGSSETPEEVGMSCVVTDELYEDYYMNSFCFGVRLNGIDNYNLNYLKHTLRSQNIRNKIAKTASGVTRFNISKARFKMISFPLPSLQEQQRIVSILDTFEASIANLESQLKLREKQYEYYRNKLLTFE